MAENAPPATTAAPANATNATAATNGSNTASTDQSSARGIPYYEKLRRELRETIQKKRLLDKSLALLEEQIYRFEQSYLEDTGAGNIIKGFDNYIKGATTTSSLSGAGSGVGSSFGTSGGGPNTRKRAQVSDADRVFSRSSVSFMRDSPAPSSATTSVAPTPTYSGPNGPSKDTKDKDSSSTAKASGSNSKKNKKSGGSSNRNNGEDDDDTADTGVKPPTKRIKITYSRGGGAD
ncbi:hypothetical protein VTO42DRAFT_3833 [Malbranchea cinnamomea]